MTEIELLEVEQDTYGCLHHHTEDARFVSEDDMADYLAPTEDSEAVARWADIEEFIR